MSEDVPPYAAAPVMAYVYPCPHCRAQITLDHGDLQPVQEQMVGAERQCSRCEGWARIWVAMPDRELIIDKGVAPTVAGVIPQEQRDDEDMAIARAQNAHQRYQDAIFAVMHQMIPHGNGVLTQAILDDLDAARAEDNAARENLDRILDEIRTGKRR